MTVSLPHLLVTNLPSELADSPTAQLALEAGLHPADLLYMYAKGVSLQHYLSTRLAGATHDEVKEILHLLRAPDDLLGYGLALTRYLASHHDILEYLELTNEDIWTYNLLRSREITHQQVLHVHSLGIDTRQYVTALSIPATHEEVMEFVTYSQDLNLYADLRLQSVSHLDIIWASTHRIHLPILPYMTPALISKSELLQLHATWPIEYQLKYIQDRLSGTSHPEALHNLMKIHNNFLSV